MAQIKPSEVSEILKKQIDGFKSEIELEEVGTVLQVGDGIARAACKSHRVLSSPGASRSSLLKLALSRQWVLPAY